MNFYHGRVNGVERSNGHLVVKWDENFFNQPDHVEVDMVLLATGLVPQDDSARVAEIFGISRSADGFFLEKHPKLAPLESSVDGIYLAGACQSPKDVPDSVIQAGGAAGIALSLIDQEVVSLDPSIAEVEQELCAGCGQCVVACQYGAISLDNGYAEVNETLCAGCGTCASTCQPKAVTLIRFDDRQLLAELAGLLQ